MLVAGAIAAPGAAGAPAKTVKPTGGATTLRIAPETAKALSDLGVSVGVLAPARATKSGPAFPIAGGRVHAGTLAGRIRHAGGLRFRAGKTVVRATRFTIRVTKHPDLTAKVGGGRIRLLALDLRKARVVTRGNRVTVGRVGATLTGPAAKALNAAFGVTAFTPGLQIGTATVRARVG